VGRGLYMKILMHYTTRNSVFRVFTRNGKQEFNHPDQLKEISKFYEKYHRTQYHMFFIVSFYNLETHELKFNACNISYNANNNSYEYIAVSDELCNILCKELGLEGENAYDNESFYRIFTIGTGESLFINKCLEDDLNKIRMKFFSWKELIAANNILFDEINDIIFNIDNVLKVASTYRPSIKYNETQKMKKYVDALRMIGFISSEGIDISHTTLHGDIGEFLMHIMLGMFLQDGSTEKYIYPKLVFKTSPKMPVFGNDGTVYIKDKNEIYYLEAKFYSNLNRAIDKAVESLIIHNETSNEHFNHRVEMFRNLKTDALDEIIEIDEDVTENLAIFLMCDNYTNYEDILKTIRNNSKLNLLKKNFNLLLFVLPILNKNEFLKYFQERSGKVWEENNAK